MLEFIGGFFILTLTVKLIRDARKEYEGDDTDYCRR